MAGKGGRRGLAALGMAAAAALPAAGQAPAVHKMVYHLNLPGGEGWGYFRQVLVNLRNHLEAVKPSPADARVVMHARGLELLAKAAHEDAQIAAAIDNMKLAGARFLACRTTMRQNNITLAQLYDAAEADVVPSGVAEVALLQHQGFAYVKI